MTTLDNENDGSNKSLVPVNSQTPSIDLTEDADDFGGGKYVSFNAADEAKYRYRKGEPLVRAPWVLQSMHKENNRWGIGENAKKIVERVVKVPGQDLPSVDVLNAAIPVKDWPENPFGPPKGPWVLNYVLGFVNPATGERIVLSNSTAGQRSAYGDLKDRVRNMTLMRGRGLAVIELGTTTMPSSYGIKVIPDFRIIDWRTMGDPTPAIAPSPDPISDNSAAPLEMTGEPEIMPPDRDAAKKAGRARLTAAKHHKPMEPAFDDGMPSSWS